MILLSLDTSFSSVNVSVFEDGKLLKLCMWDNNRKTLENLPLLLKEVGIHPLEVDAFAVSVGVGYLNPLRIGLTLVKTWAYLTKKPVIPYENLHMMLEFTPVALPRVAILRVSNKLFYRTYDGRELSPVKPLEDNPPTGSTVSLHQHYPQAHFVYRIFPFSFYGGVWAYEALLSGYKGEDPMWLEPLYLRPPA